VEVTHERADGHFQLVGVAPLCHEDHEHGAQEGSVAKLPLGGKIRKCCIENSLDCVDQLSCFR
jgi:hypothetical protein